MVLENEFFDFLKSNRITETFNYSNKSKMIVNKVKCNDKLDMLYVLDSYGGELFDLSSPFKYSGIYDKENNKLFDIEYSIRTNLLNWNFNDNKAISSSELYNMIDQDVNDKIDELIANNKKDIFNIEDVEIAEEIEEKDVLYDFMEGKTSATLEDYHKKYSTEKPQNIIDYLTDKETFLEEESRDFIMDNITEILKGLAISEEKRKVLKTIENNKEHPYHKIKEIVDAVKNNKCVTVNLTINKNGTEQTFKYKADMLKNNYNSSYLSTYGFEKAQERNLFEETFGRWDELHYEDIVKITYGKNTIYEDSHFKLKENQEEICH